MLAGAEPISAHATVYNPSDCDAREPLWSYVPARRTFSFSNLSGNVERCEARCEHERLESRVETGKTWLLPENSGSCQVFVFGDDGASFDFVEHSETGPDEVAGDPAVARSHVLDK